MVLLVVWAASGQVLQRLPDTPNGDRGGEHGPQAPSFDDTVRLASHRTLTPSGADPTYPANHMLDGDTKDLGSLPNADFEDASTTVGTPPTNSDLQTAPSSVVTVTNGTFATGTFANWTTSGTTTIQTGGPTGDWARLDSSGAFITSDAITVPSNAQELVYDVNYVSTTSYSGVDVYILSGAGFGTSTKIATDSCNACGTWSTSYWDITSYRGQSIKIKLRRTAGMNQIGFDNIDVQEVFAGYDLSGNVKRKVDSGDAHAEFSGSITSSAFTVNSATQFLTFESKKIGSSAGWDIQVAEGPSFSTFTTLDSGTLTTSWDLIRADASDYLGDQIKVRIRGSAGTIAVDDLGLMRIEVPEWPVVDETTRLLDDGAGNQYLKYHGSITSGEVEIPAGTENLLVRARDDDPVFPLQASVYVLSGTGFSTVTLTDEVDLTTSWATYRFGVGQWSGQTVKIRISTGSGTMNIDDAAPFESTLPGWSQTSGDAVQVGEDANGTYLYASDGEGFAVRSKWISTAIAGTSSGSKRYYSMGIQVGTCQACLYKAWWTNESGSTWQILSSATNPGAYQETRVWVANSMGARGYFTVQAVNGGRFYSIADNVARQQLAEPFSRKVGVGIDTSTGAVQFAQTDVSLPGPIPITFARYYNSHSDRIGPLGSRWSHSFETSLAFAGDDVAADYGSGKEEAFIHNTNGTYSPADPRNHASLVKNVDGTYALTTKDNLTYDFTAAGQLSTVTDLNGNQLALAYSSGRLASVTGEGGTAITLGYDAQGRLSTVTDPEGAVFTYGYDASGDLVTVTDPEEGVTTNTYQGHLLNHVTDAADNLVIDNDYDDLERITTQTDAAGKTISLTYDSPGQGATAVENPAGGSATFYFDRFARTTDVSDPTDRIESYVYDGDGNLDKIIDPADAEWDYSFDASGDLTDVSDPLANPSSFDYNAQHLPTTITDARGKVTTLGYDTAGNLTSVTDPLMRETTYTHDAAGNLTSVTDPLENETTYTYDAAGHRLTETNPLDKTWIYTYDAAGRKKTATDPLGNTTTYFYDLLGRLIMVRDPLDRETTILWDPAGHLLRVTNPEDEETNWFYNDVGLVWKKVDAGGKETLYGYDDDRRMTSVTDPLGRETTYTYDDAGRLISLIDPPSAETTYTYDDAGRLESKSDPLDRTTSYDYDAAGRLASVTLPNGGTIEYTHDGDGRLTSTTDPLDHVTANTYDDAGQLESTLDPLTEETTFAYDDAGRMTGQTDPLGHTVTYGYDAAGQQTSVADALDHATTYNYDDAGRLTGVTDATSRTTTYAYDDAGQLTGVTDNAGHETTNGYDDAGRLTSVELPSGATTTYGYNARGLLTSEVDPLLHETTYAYDDAGQQISMTDPRNNETTYAYNDAGRMNNITDALSGEVDLGYDDAGQLTSMTDARSFTWEYTYDELGNRESVTDPLDRSTTWDYDLAGRMSERTDARGITTTYGYDATDRLTSVGFPGGSVGYDYDDAGRRTSMTDVTGTTAWGYDDADRTTSVAAPAGTLTYAYDDAGRRTSMGLPGSRTIGYTYNTAGLLESMTDPGNRTVTFGYDVDGNRTSISRPNGVDSAYAYDAAGQIESITHEKTGTTLQSFDYTYDAARNRTSVTTAAGTESYTYDDLNRLTDVSYPGGPTVNYTYDAAGNRASETRGGSTTNYVYDAAGQLISMGPTSYGYDENGNLTSAGAATYGWDFDNRMTSASAGGHSATYRYDGDGVRTRSVVDAATTDYLVDREGGLPTVVDDGSGAYLHADGLVSKVTGSDATWALNDALGSIRGLSDGVGALTGSASYEAFGAPRTSSGASTMFGFAGEPSDAIGLVYLRARSLDPLTGRFLSADTVSPNAPGTGGYNLYGYVANNPATWIDPTGHLWTVGLFAAAVFFFVAAILAMALPELREWAAQQQEDETARDVQGSPGPIVQEPPPDITDAPESFPGVPQALVDVTTAEAARCNQSSIVITEDSIWHVDTFHSWGTRIPPGRSWWYIYINWQAWTMASKPIPAAPGSPMTNCVRTALAQIPIGINRAGGMSGPPGPTNIYTVVTEAVDGVVVTAHPGLSSGYSWWN